MRRMRIKSTSVALKGSVSRLYGIVGNPLDSYTYVKKMTAIVASALLRRPEKARNDKNGVLAGKAGQGEARYNKTIRTKETARSPAGRTPAAQRGDTQVSAKSFLGRVPDKNVEDNLEIVKEVWPPILDYAKEKGVRIAIENCPMWFTKGEWPGGQNLMTSPANWRKVFEILPYDNFGINYDPSHFVWQQIDYIKPIYEFKDKIFHVHYKDIKLFKDKLADVGVMAYPLEYMSPKLPGLGDIDWGKYVSSLTDIGYNGYSVIEVEDKAFEGTLDDAKRAVKLSAKYLRNFVG